MRDQRIDKLADVLVSYSTAVKKGDLVAIDADPIALPLISAVYERVLKAGGHPFWVPRSAELQDIFLECASEEQLDYASPVREHMIEHIDVRIAFWAEVNTKAMSNVDTTRQARVSKAQKKFFNRFLERLAAGEMRWSGTLFPTHSSAQDAEMSLREYEDFVFRAGLLHLDDPAAEWTKIGEAQERVCEFLNPKKELRFRNERGTDLHVGIDGSTWINCCGKENFPDGEVFTGPQDVNGVVCYSFPAVHGGREAHDIRLEFKDGRVVDASASKGEEFLIEMLDMDEGARRMGEIAIGTNYSIKEYTKNTLFDEKIGGTFHAAVGASYPESGLKNESSLHWDMVCDLREGGTIAADGEVFHQDGKFLEANWPGNI